MALTNKLTAIADAIRTKGGTTALLKLDDMPAAIEALSGAGGSGEDGVPNPIVYNQYMNYLFANTSNAWVWLNYGDRIQTKDLKDISYAFSNTTRYEELTFNLVSNSAGTDCDYAFNNCGVGLNNGQLEKLKINSADSMFAYYKGETIPNLYPIVITEGTVSCESMFNNAVNVKSIGTIRAFKPEEMVGMFKNCYNLRYLPEMTLDLSYLHTQKYCGFGDIFNGCYSLRKVPDDLSNWYCAATSSRYLPHYYAYTNCYVLDEINGIYPVEGPLSSNTFSSTFDSCHRVKAITFATQEDGTPYTVKWANQTIDLTKGVGWSTRADNYLTTAYNSGITVDKKVIDKTTYAALKDDPDWYSDDPQLSRFNHDSAVALINSLPDAKDYQVSQGLGNNIVKFRAISGVWTDGGAIETLTEEEIAVAAAKGWSITYAV